MTVITVASAKGGAGKTTIACGLWMAAKEAGHAAILVDADRGRSAYGWWAGHPDVATAVNGTELLRVLRRAGGRLVIVDTPPLYENKTLLEKLLRSSDVAVLPVQPARMGVERLPDILAALPEGLPHTSVPSMLRASTRAADQLREDLAEAEIRTTRTVIPLRESIAQLPGQESLGEWSILFADLLTEVLAASEAAREEVA